MTTTRTSRTLELRGLSKTFADRTVLTGFDLEVAAGDVIGLVGENGAGKSTLLNILSGVLKPSTGSILIDGRELTLNGYHSANAAGIFRVYQDPAVVGSLTVEENLFLGQERRFTRAGIVLDRSSRRREAARVLSDLEIGIKPGTLVDELPIGLRQFVSIAKVKASIDLFGITHPIVLLDEPTSSLDKEDERKLLALVAQLRQRGAIQFFVSHHLREVLEVTNRIVVLKDGSITYADATAGLEERDIHRLMVGRTRSENYYQEQRQVANASRAPRLHAAELRLVPQAAPFELRVDAGEVLGVAGLEGSGKDLLGTILAGLTPSSARISIDGRPVRSSGLRGALKEGLVYVPSDRAELGVLPESSIERNVEIGSVHDRFSTRAGFLKTRKLRVVVDDLIRAFQIATSGARQPVGQLSGGNQQKVLLSRWFSREPKVIVLDNPTQGVDTGSREAIYSAIRDAADSGAAVVVISEDLPEVIGLSDRILVVRRGERSSLIDSAPHAKPTEDSVLTSMF